MIHADDDSGGHRQRRDQDAEVRPSDLGVCVREARHQTGDGGRKKREPRARRAVSYKYVKRPIRGLGYVYNRQGKLEIMMPKSGRQTFVFSSAPRVISRATVAGKNESQGPLGTCFDIRHHDDRMGEDTWEHAERALDDEEFALALATPPCTLPAPFPSAFGVSAPSARRPPLLFCPINREPRAPRDVLRYPSPRRPHGGRHVGARGAGI